MSQSPIAGIPRPIADGLTCILAPNPSPMTYWGTNSYILGHETLAIIDPGPAIAKHQDAILAAIGGRKVSHIIVTHSHLDHSPLARPLADATGAPILAFGNSTTGRSAVMAELAKTGLMGGGEGVDPTFYPDIELTDGETIDGDGWALTALHTPGHFGNHMSFLWGEDAFTGDHLMGWATSPAELTRQIYTDIAPALLPMAQRNVLAHLVDLYGRKLVHPEGPLSAEVKFHKIS